METEPPAEIASNSGENFINFFCGIGGFLIGGVNLLIGGESSGFGIVMTVGGGYMLWGYIRTRHKPYVLLSHDRVVVFDQGKPKLYLPLNAVASVQPGFNRTRVVMRDCLTIHISHLGFMTKNDVKKFQYELSKRIGTPPATAPS